MENIIRRAGLALATFGLATTAFAGSYEPGCVCEVTIPKWDGGFRIAVEKLWYSPYINSTWARRGDFDGGNGHARNFGVEPDHELGFKVEASYCFPGTGNDMTVSYEHHDFDESTTLFGGSNSVSALTLSSAEGNALGDQSISNAENYAKGSYDVDVAVVDLEFGQAVNFGKNVTVRFHSGFRYAEVDTELVSRTFFPVGPDNQDPNTHHQATFSSDFDGIGPRVGMDCVWHVGNGFDLLTEISTAMLIGDVDNKDHYNNFFPGDDDTNIGSYSSHNDDCVVANIDLRVGARYTYVFGNNSELGLEVGYHASTFMGADNKFAPAIDIDSSGTRASASDVNYHGVYVRADYAV